MKLLLTSEGLTTSSLKNEFKELTQNLENKKVCIVYTAKNPGDEKWVKFKEEEMDELGFNYDSINISEKIDCLSDLPEYGIYYICGGNTFYILDRLKKTKMFDKIKNNFTRDVVFVGVSAGSIIAGKNIDIASIGPLEDKNDIGLKDFAGLKFVDFHFYPHFEPDAEKYIEQFFEEKEEPVVAISDQGGVKIDGEKIAILDNDNGLTLGAL